MYIGENIKHLRLQRGYSQEDLAKALGYKSYTTITKWESGVSEPTLKMTHEIARFFNVSVDDLCYTRLGMPSENTKADRHCVVIKVYGSVAAGIPLEMIEDIIDTEEITEDMARTGEFFGLKIKGDSMTPTICDGDIVIVRRQDDAESGDIVIATVNGDEATCKRLRKYKEGIELISVNPSYGTFEFSNEEIYEKPVKIIGKVVESRRKF